MLISDWSSDVCSSDLQGFQGYRARIGSVPKLCRHLPETGCREAQREGPLPRGENTRGCREVAGERYGNIGPHQFGAPNARASFAVRVRSEEHTSELQSLMRIS